LIDRKTDSYMQQPWWSSELIKIYPNKNWIFSNIYYNIYFMAQPAPLCVCHTVNIAHMKTKPYNTDVTTNDITFIQNLTTLADIYKNREHGNLINLLLRCSGDSRLKYTKYFDNHHVSTSCINLFKTNRTKTCGHSITFKLIINVESTGWWGNRPKYMIWW
jgi:hypothetical protein